MYFQKLRNNLFFIFCQMVVLILTVVPCAGQLPLPTIHLSFDGNANDVSGHGNNGIVHGAKLAADRFGKVSSCYYFDGSSYIEFPTDQLNCKAYTVMMWVRIADGQASPGNTRSIFSIGRDTLGFEFHQNKPDYGLTYSLGISWNMKYSPSCGVYEGGYEAGGSTGTYNWYHICWVKDSTNYVWQHATIYGSAQGPSKNRVPFYNMIGHIGNSYFNSCYFKGYVDDFRIYCVPLNESQINQIYNGLDLLKPVVKNDTVCPGDSVILTATQGQNYVWFDTPQMLTPIAKGNILRRGPIQTQDTFYVASMSGINYSDLSHVVVFLDKKPLLPFIAKDTAVCRGDILRLKGNPAMNYNWNNNNNNSLFEISPNVKTTYSVTVTTTAGCSVSGSIAVNVNDLPDIKAFGTSVCKGDPAKIQVSGGNKYIVNNRIYTGDSIIVSPTETADYLITGVNSLGCRDTVLTKIIVNPLPELSVGHDTSICIGKNVILTAAGIGTFHWNKSNETTQQINVSPKINTTYIVTLTDLNDCSSQDSIIVTIKDSIHPIINGKTEICKGDSSLLTASAPGNNLFIWNNNETGTQLNTHPLLSDVTYHVRVTSTDGCSGQVSVNIHVHPLPIADAGKDTIICQGNKINLTARGGNFFSWNTGDKTPVITVNAINQSEKYTVTVTDQFNCSSTDEIVLTKKDNPVVKVNADTSICKGSSLLLTASGNRLSYSWNNGLGTGSSKTILPDLSTFYTVTATNSFNCSNTAQTIVTVYALPEVTAKGGEISAGETIEISASGATNFIWSNDLGSGNIKIVNPSVTTTYIVTGMDDHTCTNSAYAIVKIDQNISIWIPSAFTPNGDGMNDVFVIYGDFISTVSIEIYNAWGLQIYSFEGKLTGIPLELWDGSYQGVSQPEGNYCYLIRAVNNEKKKVIQSGSITLLR